MAASMSLRSTHSLSASRTRLSLNGGLSEGSVTAANVPPATVSASAPGCVATCEKRSGVTPEIRSISLLLNAVSSVAGSGKTRRVTPSRYGSPLRK